MAIPLVRYPFDKTGKASTNLVVGETRTVDHEYRRAWAPEHGMYYGDSLQMWDADTGAKLYPGTDFLLLYPDPEMTARLGMPVYSLISLVNKSVVSVRYNYQVVGGDASFSIYAIQQLLNNLQQDNRVVTWDNLWGKPLTFQPTPHLHDVTTDVVGFEYLVLALEELARTINQGDVQSHDVLYDYINRVLAQLNALAKKEQEDVDNLQDQIDKLTARVNDLQSQVTANLLRLNTHMADKNNPHAVTKAQVGLGSVANYPVASTGQAQAGTDNATYMTPYLVTQLLLANVWPVINAHIADKNNPHQTTKAQVGLSNVPNYPAATSSAAAAGIDNASFMTPYLVTQQLNAAVFPVINAHLADKNNPHGVTKAQVGLSNVPNWSPGTEAAAAAGTDNASFMTPYLVTKQLAAAIWPTVNAHIANTSNPHQTTKAQVGLGNVQNYPVASNAAAAAGTDTASYMTPQLVKYVLDNNVWPTINSHVGNMNNPHQTTKAQVGLGNVQNFPVATAAQAQAGNDNASYLTPYLARLAINSLVPPLIDPRLNSMQQQINNIPYTQIQANVPGMLDYTQTTGQRIIYRINGANINRILTSDLLMHFSSYERQYFNLYVGGDGLGWQQLMYFDTGNNGNTLGHYRLKGIFLPAVGVGRYNYIMVTTNTSRSTTISCEGGDVTIAPALGDFMALTYGNAQGVGNFYTTARASNNTSYGSNR